MKDIITTVASVLILMMFMTQFVANEKTYIRVFAADSIISGYEKEWQSLKDISNQEIDSLNRELSNRLNGKVVIDGIEKNGSEEGLYNLRMKVYDVIGPYKLLTSYNDENAAIRVRSIKIEKAQEEEADEEHDNNHGTGDSVFDDVELGIQDNG